MEIILTVSFVINMICLLCIGRPYKKLKFYVAVYQNNYLSLPHNPNSVGYVLDANGSCFWISMLLILL